MGGAGVRVCVGVRAAAKHRIVFLNACLLLRSIFIHSNAHGELGIFMEYTY